MLILVLIISHLIFFTAGLLTGKNLLKYIIQEYIVKANKDNNTETSPDSKTITAYFHKDLQIVKNSPDPITTEDISLNIKQGQPKRQQTKKQQPNFIALTVLWTHFTACRDNTLTENTIPPWYNFEKQQEWSRFLDNIIKNKSWTGWINKPQEVKQRSLKAYKKIKKGNQ